MTSEHADIGAKYLSGNDLNFFERVWKTPQSIYENRLKAVGFVGHEHVLDAGAGLGQWSVALAGLNRKVTAIEYDEKRVQVAGEIFKKLGVNASIQRGDVQELPFDSDTFDAVYCYSVLTLADPVRGLRELIRVLKKGGRLYLCANGHAWYLKLVLTAPNPTSDYDPRAHGLQALLNSFWHGTFGLRPSGGEVPFPSRDALRVLGEVGFNGVLVGPEGTLNPRNEPDTPPPFFAPLPLGVEGVYELLGTKGQA